MGGNIQRFNYPNTAFQSQSQRSGEVGKIKIAGHASENRQKQKNLVVKIFYFVDLKQQRPDNKQNNQANQQHNPLVGQKAAEINQELSSGRQLCVKILENRNYFWENEHHQHYCDAQSGDENDCRIDKGADDPTAQFLFLF